MEVVDTTSLSLSTGHPTALPTRGFVFVDLRGHGQYLASRGPDAGAELRRRYLEIVRGTMSHYRAVAVATEGDGLYAVLPDVATAVRCARSILRRTLKPRDGGEPLSLSVGVHAAAAADDDLSALGGPGNLAARLAAIARPGEILASVDVSRLDPQDAAVRFVDRSPVPLRGHSEPVEVVEIVAIDGATGAGGGGSRVARLVFAVTLASMLALVMAVGLSDAPIAQPGGAGPDAGLSGPDAGLTGPDISLTGPVDGPTGPDAGFTGPEASGAAGGDQGASPSLLPPRFRPGHGGLRFR